MNDAQAMVALCRECRGLLAATVMDDDHPERWSKEVARWTRWKNPPLIRQSTVEAVRTGAGFCLASHKGGSHLVADLEAERREEMIDDQYQAARE